MTEHDLIQSEINRLWAGIIKKFDVDLTRMAITMEIDIIDSGKSESHKLRFEQIRAFFFNNLRYLEQQEEWKYIELSEIHYYPKTLQDTDLLIYRPLSKLKREESMVKPNFVLIIWSTELLIQSSVLSIDNNTFQVG